MRLIGANGEQMGVIPTTQALEMAREAQLDLVEVAPTERPPVCKIMDFGKFRYQQTHIHGRQASNRDARAQVNRRDWDTRLANFCYNFLFSDLRRR